MDKRDVIVIGVIVTCVNIAVFQQARIAKLQDHLNIAEMRAEVNAETTQELLWDRLNDVHKATQDQLIAQGRIEGLVSYFNGDDKTDLVNKLWHEGYEHGLRQTEYVEGHDVTQIAAQLYHKRLAEARKAGKRFTSQHLQNEKFVEDIKGMTDEEWNKFKAEGFVYDLSESLPPVPRPHQDIANRPTSQSDGPDYPIRQAASE